MQNPFPDFNNSPEIDGVDCRFYRSDPVSLTMPLTGLRKKDRDIRREKSEKGVTVYKTAER